MQGASQENLWPKSSLERPVARHFVWAFISIWRAVSKPLKIQARSLFRFVGIALGRERFTSGVETRAEPRQVFVEIVRRSNLCVVPKLSRRPYQERRARPPGMPLSAEVRGEKVRNFGPRVNECNGDISPATVRQPPSSHPVLMSLLKFSCASRECLCHRSLNSQPMPMARARRTCNCEKGC
jgi:hypothetical protein